MTYKTILLGGICLFTASVKFILASEQPVQALPIQLDVENYIDNSDRSKPNFPLHYSIEANAGERLQAAESSDDGGIPALRRQPSEGEEKFEPRRIPLRVPVFPRRNYRASPSVTIINPSGYGASWGSGGIGVGCRHGSGFLVRSVVSQIVLLWPRCG